MQDRNLQVGDRVKMSPMWKYESADGSVIKITKDYMNGLELAQIKNGKH